MTSHPQHITFEMGGDWVDAVSQLHLGVIVDAILPGLIHCCHSSPVAVGLTKVVVSACDGYIEANRIGVRCWYSFRASGRLPRVC